MPVELMEYSWFVAISLSACLCAATLSFLLFLPTTSSTTTKPGKNGKPPPRPPSLPLIDSLLWLRRPLVDLGPALRRLADEYGPIVTFKFGLFPAVFITDHQLAREVLVTRGATFSDRPRLPSNGVGYIDTSNGHIISASSGALWRLLRRNLTSEILHLSRVGSYSPGRRWALDMLLDGLRSMAEAADGVVAVAESFQTPVFSLLTYMCFGEKLDMEVIGDIERVQMALTRMGFQLNVFDIMPRLAKLFLWKKWKAFLATRHQQEAIFLPLIRSARRGREREEEGHGARRSLMVSYVDTLVDLVLPEEGGRKLDDNEIVSLCYEFFTAGVDTTATALQWIMANLVKSPDVQRKLLEEIRSVVGEDEGEVKEEDLQKIPYLKAVILEGLRRHPPAHILLPHVASEEATVQGYLIPKGAVVNVTVAEFGRDKRVWKDPMEFRPERFMPGGEGEGVDITGSREITMIPFGAGRRICPGHALAMLHLEYFVANLVWAFEWRRVAGEEVDLSEAGEFTVTMKNPLRAHVSPRRK